MTTEERRVLASLSCTEEALQQVVHAFQDAALDDALWMAALSAMADLTGSKCGQLIGFDQTGNVTFNWITEVPPEMLPSLAEAGGNDPQVNSRIRIGLKAPLLTLVDEADFETESDIAKAPAYGEHLRYWDAPYVACANLIRSSRLNVGVSVNRSARQEGLTAEGKRLLNALLPHVRAAVGLRSAWAAKEASMAAATAGTLNLAAFVCDSSARVLAMTPRAEGLAATGGIVSLSNGRLSARTRTPGELQAALARLSAAGPTPSGLTLILQDTEAASAVACDIFRLSSRSLEPLGSDSLLVVVRVEDASTRERIVETAARMYLLTYAEAKVASSLLAGHSPELIAAAGGVTIGTIRSQIRSLYEKTGSSNQLTFVSALNRAR